MIEFKDEESKKIEINEKEKYLEIKKEILKILEIKKEKKYGESVWYDEEYYTISDIVKHLNITLDRFLREKK